jgi:hypothetical protein
MPNVPKQKPYTEEKFKQDADKFIKGYLGGFDQGEMNEFLKRSVDKIENAGVMSSDEAKDFIKERASYLREFAKDNPGETLPQLKADGGRIGFLEGGDTAYNAMVFRMYTEAGGQEGTGMDIDTFAEKYFPKMANGGRIGFKDGLNPNEKGPMGPVFTTNKPGEAAKEVIKRFVNIKDANIPLDEKISISLQGLDKAEIQGVMDVLGGELFFGLGKKGDEKGLGFNFIKKFSTGGRTNYNEGSLDPDTLALKEKIEEIMDIEGVGFGEAFKQAMRELASQSKEND